MLKYRGPLYDPQTPGVGQIALVLLLALALVGLGVLIGMEFAS